MKLRILSMAILVAAVAFAVPARADNSIVSLQFAPDNTSDRIDCKDSTMADRGFPKACQSIALANSSKASFTASSAYLDYAMNADKIIMLDEKEGVACLVEAGGSPDGSVKCGLVDKD